jgi:tetratricopeptide (TPR) repeat protein
MTDADSSSYQDIANQLKDQGNAAFQANDFDAAITCYSQAIDIDPDNHVLYSNRSAAYLKADQRSKALYDAEKCVALAPVWSKGYSRLGAAQQALKRFDNAIDSFKRGIVTVSFFLVLSCAIA